MYTYIHVCSCRATWVSRVRVVITSIIFFTTCTCTYTCIYVNARPWKLATVIVMPESYSSDSYSRVLQSGLPRKDHAVYVREATCQVNVGRSNGSTYTTGGLSCNASSRQQSKSPSWRALVFNSVQAAYSWLVVVFAHTRAIAHSAGSITRLKSRLQRRRTTPPEQQLHA
jgi:predicted phosphoadenosine phosphosulfate sulfurtransferase